MLLWVGGPQICCVSAFDWHVFIANFTDGFLHVAALSFSVHLPKGSTTLKPEPPLPPFCYYLSRYTLS